MSMIEKHPQSTPLVYTFEIEIDLVKLDPMGLFNSTLLWNLKLRK